MAPQTSDCKALVATSCCRKYADAMHHSGCWLLLTCCLRAQCRGCTQYQDLHRDFGDFLNDPSGRLDFRDLPPSEIAVNYPMEVVDGSDVGHTPWNGVSLFFVSPYMSGRALDLPRRSRL
jgi:hypothetical protein